MQRSINSQNRLNEFFSHLFLLFFLSINLLFILPLKLHAGLDDYANLWLTQKDGLSSDIVYAVTQDTLGFIWIGTENGLNRYDGFEFKKYYHEPGDPSSLCANFIWDVFIDSHGRMWVGTIEGLNLYNPVKDNFIAFQHDPADEKTLSNSYVRTIGEDKTGAIWVGTINGLNRLDETNQSFEHFLISHESISFKNLTSNYILRIYRDSFNRFWIGTAAGVFRYDYESDCVRQEPLNCELEEDTANSFLAIQEIDSLNLYLSGWGLYVYQYNIEKKESRQMHGKLFGSIAQLNRFFKTPWQTLLTTSFNKFWEYDYLKAEAKELHYKRNNSIVENWPSHMCYFVDTSNNIWCGTAGLGILLFFPDYKKFQTTQFENKTKHLQISHMAKGIGEDVWVGTNQDHLMQWRRKSNTIKTHLVKTSYNTTAYIIYLYFDSEHHLWIGGLGSASGLHQFDLFTKKRRAYYPTDSEAYRFLMGDVNLVWEDPDRTIWITTQQQTEQLGGLHKLDVATGKFTHFIFEDENPNSLSSYKIKDIALDGDGNFWLGTWAGGLNKFDPQTGHAIHFKKDSQIENSLTDNNINSLLFTNDSTLWIGTNSGGLNKMNIKSRRFKSYTVKSGLPNNEITGIVEDKNAKLWLATGNGLTRFDPATEKMKTFGLQDGLPSLSFVPNTFVTMDDDEILLAWKEGVLSFYPEVIRENPYPPSVQLTALQIMNNSAQLDTIITLKKHITLNHSQNVFSFEFAALNYVNPTQNKYKYKMEGFDEKWQYSGTRRRASYTNLAPGDYTFRVLGANNDEVWDEKGTSIRVTITPPIYRTTAAYFAYSLLFVLSVIWWRRNDLKRQRIRNELQNQRFEAQKLREVDELKTRFFANISHEFRSPLTLILGPVERMLSKAPNSFYQQNLTMMHRNAQRLLQLINQLLDLSRLEARQMHLTLYRMDAGFLLRGLTQSFASTAEQKNIELEQSITPLLQKVWIDRDKFEKIVSNLLSNAFKFTPATGKISVSLRSFKKHVPGFEIIVKDSGEGIPAAEAEKIFDRFYQLNGSTTREHEGSGIGLTLVKELVDLQKGEIHVESEIGVGSTFTVWLPNNPHELMTNEERKTCRIVGDGHENYETVQKVKKALPTTPDTRKICADSAAPNKDRPVVLVVEDNPDVRWYIRSYLEVEYHIVEAENGFEGLKKARACRPDILVIDLMMPKMNGIDLCRKLKTDDRTSHIPIILLTAKADAQTKIESFETGADVYLTKPFDAKELRARLKNLLRQRRLLMEKFNRQLVVKPQEITVTSMDEEILNKAIKIVEEHLDDFDFNVTKFAKKMAMSRQHLNRKLHDITDSSAGEFIRAIRLKRAAQLLKQNGGRITEIAYQVGFSNPSHFSNAFREKFGVLPKVYQKDEKSHNDKQG
ncbi:MAG: response regulator [Deferribacteres bacterium]|nr:response regulator [candidate division KSB1 bacterium]MCB9503802.1 response regulator [Deferribacteres bacterium]